MKKLAIIWVVLGGVLIPDMADAQKKKEAPVVDEELASLIAAVDSAETPIVITLEDALKIALSENTSVKVADMEIQRSQYAKKGTYASLFPQIDLNGSYQYTIKKQVMYMDVDLSKMMGPAAGGSTGSAGGTGTGSTGSAEGGSSASTSAASNDGIEVGRSNIWSGGVSVAMPIVNAQLWKSIDISGLDVEIAVEKARSSRLETVTQVKNAFFGTLLAKEAFNVYKDVYENAVKNYEETLNKFNSQKISEMELVRAKTTVANAIPNVYNAESSVILSLWQLKAVLGVDLEANIDIAGSLEDYSKEMFYELHQHDSVALDNNTTMKQLELQLEMLAENVKLQKFAYIPTLSVAFSFSINAMANDFNFSQYRWNPQSYVGLSLSIPIFSGGKRFYNVRQSQNQYNQLKLQTADTERQLRIAIKQNLITMETNMKTYYASEEAVAAAQKGYDIAEKAYEVGRSTLIELNDAQLALTQARLAQYQAVYNFVIAKAQLEQTLGQDFIK